MAGHTRSETSPALSAAQRFHLDVYGYVLLERTLDDDLTTRLRDALLALKGEFLGGLSGSDHGSLLIASELRRGFFWYWQYGAISGAKSRPIASEQGDGALRDWRSLSFLVLFHFCLIPSLDFHGTEFP